MKKKVLVLEDEDNIRAFVVINLKRAGYETVEFALGEEAAEHLRDHRDVAIAILDVMLPDISGFDVCRRIRGMGSKMGVIMLTAMGQESDRVTGLMTGADDYVTKPFSVKELVARIRANTRRKGDEGRSQGDRQSFGPYTVDTGLQAVLRDGKPVELTQREYDLVCYFLASAGRVVSREELMEKVWGYDYYGDLRAVDVAMRRLREKLEADPANPQYFMTKRGAGYYLQK